MRPRNLSLVALFPLILLMACETGTAPRKEPEAPQQKTTFTMTDFTDTLAKLDRTAPGAIENGLQVYSALVPHDSTFADSAASALMQWIDTIVRIKNDSLFQHVANGAVLADPALGNLTEQQKSFLTSLHASRLKAVGDGEGGIYLKPLYETILPSLKAKTSAPVDTYFDLVAREDTTPTFLDAGLAIEIEELADRLVNSERLLAQTLPQTFQSKTAALNRFYTRAFVFGADNSPALMDNPTQLTENFRKGYDYLLAKYPSSKAAETVKSWMTVVASGDPKRREEFRKSLL